MKQELAQIALLVADYDEAIKFYTEKLNFELIEDSQLSETKRWVLVAPPNSVGAKILLAKAVGEQQTPFIGNQSGGRVFLFLHTDDFDRDYANLIAKEIRIVREMSVEEYGKVAVFADLYGNLWDLIEKK